MAYETLLDPVKRRRYDSSLPFDDIIPEDSQITSEKKFYQLFNRSFVNNARFSTIKPVPTLGKEHAAIQEVDEFYKFWFNFKSWRDFSQYDDYDVEEAQDRYEARWMNSQNRKIRAEYERQERSRVNELVTRSYNHDPRIKAQRQLEIEKKQAAKQLKKASKINYYKEIEEKINKIEKSRLDAEKVEEAKRQQELEYKKQ